jgi:cytochrome c peroxidase
VGVWHVIQQILNSRFAGKLVKEDIRLAYRSFDMDPMMEVLKKGKKSVK